MRVEASAPLRFDADRVCRPAGRAVDGNCYHELFAAWATHGRCDGYGCSMPAHVDLHRALVGGGPQVLTELAGRTLGFSTAVAIIVQGGEQQVLARYGPPSDGVAGRVADATQYVVSGGRAVESPDLLSVPIRSGNGADGAFTVAGLLERPRDDALELLVAFAQVLSGVLDLLARVPGPDIPHERVTEIGDAIAAGELVPWYQPLVHLASGRLVGFEALARWERGSGEVTMPSGFIDVAEQSGLIVQLDLAIADRACGDLARWHEARPDLRLGLNLSARHLDDARCDERLDTLVQNAGVDPRTVDVELTETARPSDAALGAETLTRLQARGYSIWFDDFGTGWSELQDLVALPVDGLKIDRFFAESLGTRADAVVRAMTTAAREMGIRTTIEGISQPGHRERALTLGCDLAQGFLWSPAVPAARIDEVFAGTAELPGVLTGPEG